MRKPKTGARHICWPCAAGNHKRCDRKSGRSYIRNWTSLIPNQGEVEVECDCYPDHKLTY